MTVMNPTPFGFFDSNPQFQADADKVVTFVLRKLGEDVLGVELTKKMIWSCFEEATLGFNALMIEYQAKSNLASLLGTPTGSLDPGSGFSTINLLDVYTKSNLEFMVKQQEQFAAEVGIGTSAFTISGSITLTDGKQDYDLYTDLVDASGNPVAGLQPTGSVGKLKVFEVFHYSPTPYVYNSNYAGVFTGTGLPVEAWVPDTRYMVLPIGEDVLRGQMLEEAQRLRRSHFSYKITGRNIRILPVPQGIVTGENDKVWLRVGWGSPPLPGYMDNLVVSGTLGSFVSGPLGYVQDQTLFGVSNPANVPYGLINYTTLNPWARNWIYQYTLALSKELLGIVRTKVKSIILPNDAAIELNGELLLTQAREDKEKMKEALVEKLESLSYDKLAELEAAKVDHLIKILQLTPFPPEWIVSTR